uniref:Uncharacterized protein n=1 Tax=Arundo donax TaxID=35708 RepID=A0A0A9HDC8_ARUDO
MDIFLYPEQYGESIICLLLSTMKFCFVLPC